MIKPDEWINIPFCLKTGFETVIRYFDNLQQNIDRMRKNQMENEKQMLDKLSKSEKLLFLKMD